MAPRSFAERRLEGRRRTSSVGCHGSRDRGAAVLELVLVTPVLALLALGLVDLARCYHAQIRLENAAREGGAYAQIRPDHVSCPDDDDITDRVVGEDPDSSSDDGFAVRVLRADIEGALTVPVRGCGTSAVASGERLRVEVAATYEIMTPFVRRVLGSSVPISGSYQLVVQ